MRQIKNESLGQLLMQLKFTPLKKRRKQLVSAEKLLSIIRGDKEYPFDFVCYHITGYRPKQIIEQPLIKGSELVEDLRLFISKLSSQIDDRAEEQKEKIYAIEEIAGKFNVSTKTIDRWRKRGLIARKFLFGSGKKKLGFMQSAVDDFISKNPQIVAKAGEFKRISEEEKKLIIKKAAVLAVKGRMSRTGVASEVASELGIANETVRYTILNYEKKNPNRKVFGKNFEALNSARSAEIYKLYNQGCNINELIERFRRSKSSIYRIINIKRARIILAAKIEFVENPEFAEEGAEGRILGVPLKEIVQMQVSDAEALKSKEGSLSRYTGNLQKAPVFNREMETELFRRYNFLKYLACLKRVGIKPTKVSSALLDVIEGYLEEAEVIKKILIETNLWLVVSIASKHTSDKNILQDLVSEGNISLMRAVEKFDYAKGFRFNTFASWVITKDYARKMPAEAGRFDKAAAESMDNIQRDFRATTAAGVEAVEKARKSLADVIKDNLGEREQYIIMNHFGLVGTLIRKERRTLKQIGDELGLSKERVRQLELLALQKLKQLLSAEEFELLTG